VGEGREGAQHTVFSQAPTFVATYELQKVETMSNAPPFIGPFTYTLPTFQVAEDFALPAATASSSLWSFAPLLAAEHFRLLALGCGTACHRRLRWHRLWRPSALDSRHFCLLNRILNIRLI